MFTIHVPTLIASEFLLFITPDFTTNAQNILNFNQRPHGDIISWIVALFKISRGRCKWCLRQQKYVDEVYFHSQLEMNALRFLRFSKDKNLKD
jgi:hypothetical protein